MHAPSPRIDSARAAGPTEEFAMFADRIELDRNLLRPGLAGIGIALCLAGCATGDAVEAPELARDGIKCGSTPAAGAVYLEVGYDATGMPRVDPEICEIDRGTRVSWRGPVAQPVVFEVRFKGPSPVPQDPRGVLGSTQVGERQRIRRELDGAPGRYDYGVIANGRELDPAIIIR
jgi:hypothetical protein